MVDTKASAPAPSSTANPVPEMIQRMKASKATGKFTYHAGRYDGVINMAILGVFTISLYAVGTGGYNLATGKGKKPL